MTYGTKNLLSGIQVRDDDDKVRGKKKKQKQNKTNKQTKQKNKNEKQTKKQNKQSNQKLIGGVSDPSLKS